GSGRGTHGAVRSSSASVWFSVSADNVPASAGNRLKVPAGTPRRAADYPDAFSDWNFISSIGAHVCAASSSPLRRHGRSALPCDFFLLFFLGDGGDGVDQASDAAARKGATGIHQGLVIGKPSMCFREVFEGRPGRDDFRGDHVIELTEYRGDVFARQGVHGCSLLH